MEEIWKIIPGWEKRYQASNLGRIRSLCSGRDRYLKIRKTYKEPGKYERITFRLNGKVVAKAVHRLVMSAFHGESTLHVNHINGEKHDNRLENLEYLTRKQNSCHARDELNVRFGPAGNPQFAHRARMIKTLLLSGYSSVSIAGMLNVATAVVSRIKTGKAWADVKPFNYVPLQSKTLH